MINVTAILTCYNRREKTVNCLKSLVEGNKNINFSFIVVDDNSSDGTVEAVQALGYNTHIIKGIGNLYWCGGMRKGIEYFLSSNPKDTDFCLFVNDDVDFFNDSIEKMLKQINKLDNTVIVGATCDSYGDFSYGLRKLRSPISTVLESVLPNNQDIIGDTMNANCVLLRNSIIKLVGNFDSIYSHNFGDFDYGYLLTKKGYKLISSREYVGVCTNNSVVGTWRDRNLSLKQRIKLKESPKGGPFKEWWHFLYKNYGLFNAIFYSITPYIRILFNL